jgi:hypothetical protein
MAKSPLPTIKGGPARTGLVNGALGPSASVATKMVRQLQRDIERSSRLRETFRKDPSKALAAMGLNEDVRREALRDSGMSAKNSCWFTCVHTCWFSDCLCTKATFIINA